MQQLSVRSKEHAAYGIGLRGDIPAKKEIVRVVWTTSGPGTMPPAWAGL